MKKLIKAVLLAVPGGLVCLTLFRRMRKHLHLRRFKTHEEVFSHFHQNNSWGTRETVSGAGSTLEYTANIRAELPGLIESLGVKSFLDAPCGDFHWMKHVSWKGEVFYIGGDIVPTLVKRVEKEFGNTYRKFMLIDICGGPLPEADLWLCRDCLFHLPLLDIQRALTRFRESQIKYLLTTIYADVTLNTDILAGDFRPIDLQLAPFNLCPPRLLIDDWCPGYPVRYLALWERGMIS